MGIRWDPLLSSRDRILIDVSQRVPVPPGLFVIWDGMGLVAKRIEHVPHSDPPKVLIKSVKPEVRQSGTLSPQTRRRLIFHRLSPTSVLVATALNCPPDRGSSRECLSSISTLVL